MEFNHVAKSYGENLVLDNINCEVKRGEFITMVGTSGCGKSTFLNMLLGTVAHSKGDILLEGKPIVAEPSPDRGIVFQKYSVFPHLSVRENVAISKEFEASPVLGRLFGERRKQALTETDEWLEAVGLLAAKDKYPHELSGGMQQRLAIAQALIKHPKVLLLDEPFGALDPGIRKDMHKLVLELWKKYQLTIFMVTHDLNEGFYLGTRLWVFDKTRHDPHAPHRYGSTITFDLPIGKTDEASFVKIEKSLESNRLSA
ncbi:lauroyl acyltransferase [Marinomonas sp. SBI22]|nr:lauroyl acyltransferase [Marinomonas sp. SBI22]KZM47348.1 lauroyl acyltransferase [Marinomonas sp. SBI8L]